MNTDKIFAEAIANEYAPKNASKVLALKKLDRKAKRKANIFAYTFGTLMALVLGTGMCLSMGVLGSGSIMMTGLPCLRGSVVSIRFLIIQFLIMRAVLLSSFFISLTNPSLYSTLYILYPYLIPCFFVGILFRGFGALASV